MPAKGGTSGKFGDKYEALWTVDAALRVIDGRATHVTYESLAPEESRGVEFLLHSSTGNVEFWSLKRQTTAGLGWSLATLVSADQHGRSILGDLVAHTEKDDRNVAVFASTLGAAYLEELRSVAATADILQQRLAQSERLRSDYDRLLLSVFHGNKESARRFLTRLQIRTTDEMSLRINIESLISLMFYPANGGPVDAGAVRRLLAEYLLDQMHQQVDQTMLLDHLAIHGLRRKDWKVDTQIREKVKSLCDHYTRPLRQQLIGGMLQTLPGTEALLGLDGLPAARRTLISGGAGGGKSSASANVVERLQAACVPTLPVRMDVIGEGVLTSQRLGQELSLPASPVAVLAGLADGGNCVLVVDQLDAVSLVSGRRTEVWSLFEQLLAEVDAYPNMRVIVACRTFDLEHDHRIRSLRGTTLAFTVVTIGSFDSETMHEILGHQEIHPRLEPLLTVPLHLAMLLSLDASHVEGLETRDQLFAAFWAAKQRQCSLRLGRECKFAEVVDWLTRRLSDNQELSAPAHILPDEFRADADALTSEHVLVLAEDRYRFFHETFFDYAFARRFAQTGKHLLELLMSGEQHLFRRGQVRQVLSLLRSGDLPRYVTELRSVVLDDNVRFHIKRMVLRILSATADPMPTEWAVLRTLETARPAWVNHVNSVISNRVAWFDRLDADGFLESGLSSGASKFEERIVWLCGRPEILKHRSARVATLLSQHRRDDDGWRKYLQHICGTGEVYHSREALDLFLSLIRDGTLDGTRPGFAANDNWWSALYSMAEKAPAMAAEALAAWLDRKTEVWEEMSSPQAAADVDPDGGEDKEGRYADKRANSAVRLRHHLTEDGDDQGVIAKAAAGAPKVFAEQLLRRIATFVAKYAMPRRDLLDADLLWSCRGYGDNEHQVDDSLFTSLARALESLASSAPAELDSLLAPYTGLAHDAIAYLVLRAWSAAPARYAERLALYLAEDPRRMKVGYAISSGDAGAGVASIHRSIEAVRAASPGCSPQAFAALESAIVNLRDAWQSRSPRWRGIEQLQLLAAIDQRRLGQSGLGKLAELQAKFPEVTHEPPKPLEWVCVGSPIPADAQDKMTDDQWLKAMRKYAGIDTLRDRGPETSGGELQLSQSLRSKVKANPKRFAALTARMAADLPASYFDAILQGVAEAAPPDEATSDGISLTDAVSLIERIHALPQRPCGRGITALVSKWRGLAWPPSIVEAIVWYAKEDPDPIEETWRRCTPSGQPNDDGDPDFAGLNSTRGSAANAVTALLFADRGPADLLIDAVDSLAHDASIAVRSQAAYALLALLNTHPDLSLQWFVECVSVDTVLLQTRFVEHFLRHAGHRHYVAIRPVLQGMIWCDNPRTTRVGASVCCMLALTVEEAAEDALQVRDGSSVMREAAVTIYATNVANKVVGPQCRELLLPFFADDEEIVRAIAATAFRHIAELDTKEQARLLGAFLDANPKALALRPVIHAIEHSPVRLPDLVCRLIETGVEHFKVDAGNIASHGALITRDLSKIVIRLYTQSDDDAIKTRCLDAIDGMEAVGFFGLSDELERIDR